MKAYIFYNGDDFAIPDEQNESKWGEYRNPDSGKMFAVCADTWERYGWEVERLVLRTRPYSMSRVLGGSRWSGRLAQSSYRYNDLVPALLDAMVAQTIIPTTELRAGVFIVTTDVLNNGFYPMFVDTGADLWIPADYFTMSVGWFSYNWLHDAEKLLRAYDDGFGDDVPDHTDESLLRRRFPVGSQDGIHSDYAVYLKHYSRSMLRREIEKRTTVEI